MQQTCGQAEYKNWDQELKGSPGQQRACRFGWQTCTQVWTLHSLMTLGDLFIFLECRCPVAIYKTRVMISSSPFMVMV